MNSESRVRLDHLHHIPQDVRGIISNSLSVLLKRTEAVPSSTAQVVEAIMQKRIPLYVRELGSPSVTVAGFQYDEENDLLVPALAIQPSNVRMMGRLAPVAVEGDLIRSLTVADYLQQTPQLGMRAAVRNGVNAQLAYEDIHAAGIDWAQMPLYSPHIQRDNTALHERAYGGRRSHYADFTEGAFAAALPEQSGEEDLRGNYVWARYGHEDIIHAHFMGENQDRYIDWNLEQHFSNPYLNQEGQKGAEQVRPWNDQERVQKILEFVKGWNW